MNSNPARLTLAEKEDEMDQRMDLTPSIMSRFKRYYRKMQKAAAPISKSAEGFGFRLTSTGNEENPATELSLTGPPEDQRVRLAVVMERFLTPEDDLYYGRIWGDLKTHFAEEIPADEVKHVDERIAEWKSGLGSFNINGQDLDMEGLFHSLRLNHRWVDTEHSQIQPAEQDLEAHMRAYFGSFLLPFFYSYIGEGFALAEYLFQRISQLEPSEKFRQLYPEHPPEANKCIYCLSTTNAFTTEEHPVPEALGNQDLYLPKGFVCDVCQAGKLAELDKKLTEVAPIAYMRVLSVPYTKDAKLPHADLPDMTIRKTHPGKIIVKSKTSRDMQDVQELEDGQVSWKVPMGTINIRLLARCLYKMALGALAFEEGHDAALNSRYDAARRFVLVDKDFRNNLLVPNTIRQPDISGVSITQFGPPLRGSICQISLFGFVFVLNLEEVPLLALQLEEKETATAFPLFKVKKRRPAKDQTPEDKNG